MDVRSCDCFYIREVHSCNCYYIRQVSNLLAVVEQSDAAKPEQETLNFGSFERISTLSALHVSRVVGQVYRGPIEESIFQGNYFVPSIVVVRMHSHSPTERIVALAKSSIVYQVKNLKHTLKLYVN